MPKSRDETVALIKRHRSGAKDWLILKIELTRERTAFLRGLLAPANTVRVERLTWLTTSSSQRARSCILEPSPFMSVNS